MFDSETMVGIRPSANTTASAQAVWCDPDGLVVSSETTSTSWGAGVTSDTTGAKGTAQFFLMLFAAYRTRAAPMFILRVPWTLTTQSAGTPQGTIHVRIIHGATVIGEANGASRSLSAANGTQYTEIIAIPLAAPINLDPGNLIYIEFQPTVTVPSGSAGSTFEATLRHDPATLGSQLVCEIQGAMGIL